MSNELNLPNPGDGRYWDVSVTSGGYFEMTLRSRSGALIGRAYVPEVAVDSNGHPLEADEKPFLRTAHTLMRTQSAEERFAGTYKYEETN